VLLRVLRLPEVCARYGDECFLRVLRLPEVCARYGVESLRHVLGRSQPEYTDLARLEVSDHGFEALCRGEVCVADARTVDDDRDNWGPLHKNFISKNCLLKD
jgi:hypothetical protein